MRAVLSLSTLFLVTFCSLKAVLGAVTPPVRQPAPALVLPAGTVTAGGTVLLEILVDAEGRVQECSIVSGLGEPVDSAVLSAVASWRFVPAMQDDQAVAARIRVAFDVAEAPAKTEDTPPQPPTTEPNQAAPAEPAATQPVMTRAPVKAPAPPAVAPEFGAVARIETPSVQVAERREKAQELRQVAGASGDALKGLETRPGVTRGGDLNGAPLLRGSSWNESLVLVADAPVPLLYHVGGLKSVYNSLLVDEVRVVPSNFGVRHGRVTGGIIEVIPRQPRIDGYHATLELSLLDSSALVEGPLTGGAGIALAARRSNIDLVFEQVAGSSDFDVVAAPIYWDYEGIAAIPLGARHQLTLHGFGARDGFRLVLAEPDPDDPVTRGNYGAVLKSHRFGAVLQSEFAHGFEQRLTLLVGRRDGQFETGPWLSDYGQTELFARADWTLPLHPTVTLNLGLDHTTMRLSGVYQGTRVPQSEGDVEGYVSESLQEIVEYRGSLMRHQPAAYAELNWFVSPRLTVVPGVRTDYDSQTHFHSADPRLAASYALYPHTTLKWGVGQFTQPPEYYEALARLGNPQIEPFRALHANLGVERRWGRSVELGVQAFAKHIVHRITSVEGGAEPHLVNDGKGRVLGGEVWLMARHKGTSGTLAYTLTSSRRRDHQQAWRPVDSEQPHVLVVTGQQDMGRHWVLAGSLRLASGTPVTPVRGSVYDAGLGLYRPVFGKPYSERNPMQQRLDVRLSKRWELDPIALTAFVEVQNLTNAENAEGYDYSYDYSKREASAGMPMFPNLGITGEI